MSHTGLRRVLVANRGEIAVRIVRACRSLGVECVAVYSDADADALHVQLADDAVRLGAEPAAESYLHVARMVDAATATGCDAVHPGYGFIAERPDAVEAFEAAGITWIGPSAAAMRALGDKAAAKRLAGEARVPTVPEWAPDEVPDAAYPVLVKAAAGGGGRGMRRVARAADLPGALEAAGREAGAAFGDGTLLVEQLIEGARHVEVQLLADAHGTCLYVGDRDCSLQRRHQKVVEEAPAPGLSHDLRRVLGSGAIALARAAGYVGAGTAEFLVDRDGGYHFLELNARLQVEHPVTELVYGIDLVAWQMRIAGGAPLDVAQDELIGRGHAIEARVYAEDPVAFLPTGGEVLELSLPEGPGLRIDHALAPGTRVSLAYDPLLAKVIAWGADREDARQRLLHALRHLTILGTVTNAALLQHALVLEPFVADVHDTATLEANLLCEEDAAPTAAARRAARHAALPRRLAAVPDDPFHALGSWRASQSGMAAEPRIEGATAATAVRPATTRVHGDRIWVSVDGVTWELPRRSIDTTSDASGPAGDGHARLVAPMPGTVLSTLPEGTAVSRGDAVVVLEAMKMENAITAPCDGRVGHVACEVGDLVTRGALLAEVAP